VSALVYFGRSGVTFFFVLSGFVLAWTYLDTRVRLQEFWWRRFARLWPLVAVTGLLSLLAYAAVGRVVSPEKALTTFVFLQAWHSAWVSGANPAAWSLSDEAFFYLVFPLLLAAVRARRGWTVVATATILSLPLLFILALEGGWMDARFDYHPLSRLPHFLVGVVCGVAVRRGRRLPVGLGAAGALVAAYHAGLYCLSTVVDAPRWLYSGSQWWSVIPFALLIVSAAQADLERRPTVISGAWSLRLGHWSFAWYLVHELVIRVSNHWLGRPEAWFAVTVRWVLVLLVSLAIAGLMYSKVEHPAERWLRHRGPGRARYEVTDANR